MREKVSLCDTYTHTLTHTIHSQYTGQNILSHKQLYDDLTQLPITPTHILHRAATFNDSAWQEHGYGVYYSWDDLSRHGQLSSDGLRPWKRVLPQMLAVARKFKQIHVTVWYPHQFGGTRRRRSSAKDHRLLSEKDAVVVPLPYTPATETETAEDGTVLVHSTHRALQETHEPWRHINIVQEVVPTRTGLHGIKCSGAVWVSAINGTEPFALLHKLTADW